MDTPYQWTKQVASHWGGTRNGTIVHWPNGIKAKGEIRAQFHHVIDVAPTVLEAAGLPAPLERQRRAAAAARGRLDGLRVRRRGRRGAPHDAVLRDVLQPRHLPRGLDRGDAAQHPVGRRRRCPRSTTTSGSCTRPTTGRRRTTSPPSSPRSCRAAAAVPDRGGEVQRAAARRPPLRAVQPRSAGPAAARPGHVAAPVRPHGPPVRELGRRDEEQVALDHGGDRRARGRARTA